MCVHVIYVCTCVQVTSAWLQKCYSENNSFCTDNTFVVTCIIWAEWDNWKAYCASPSLLDSSSTVRAGFHRNCGIVAAHNLSFPLGRQKPKLGPQVPNWDHPKSQLSSLSKQSLQCWSERGIAGYKQEATLPTANFHFRLRKTSAAIGHQQIFFFLLFLSYFLYQGKLLRCVSKVQTELTLGQGSAASVQAGWSHTVNKNDWKCPKSQLIPSDACSLSLPPGWSTHCTDVPFLQGNWAAESNMTLHQLRKA